jgi:hypothetical protein
MSRRRPIGWFTLAGTASGGVILGHWLAYVAAVPGPAARARILSATGHGYWLGAVKVAGVLAVASVGATFVGHLSRRLRDEWTEPRSLFGLTLPLAGLQVAAFTVLEVVERLVAGAPLGGALHHGLFLLGVAVQVLVAAAGAMLLLWLGRSTERIDGLVRSPRFAKPVLRGLLPQAVSIAPIGVESGAAGLRGPPRA